MKSWKTTLAGLIASLSLWAATAKDVRPWVNDLGKFALSAGIAGIGLNARDKNVSSEQQTGKVPQPPTV